MVNPKQNIVPADGVAPDSVQAAALSALEAAQNTGAPKPDEVTSLNKLLQWGAAHSAPKEEGASAEKGGGPRNAPQDMEWLSAAFPDMNAAVKRLIELLNKALPETGDPTEPAETIAELLEELEEYLSDLNYARNVASLGVLPPVMRSLVHSAPSVRAAAVWCVGSALQDMPENATGFAAAGGLPHMIAALQDEAASVRAKGVRAASAFLRAADEKSRDAFRELGAGRLLVLALCDKEQRVQARAFFVLANAADCGSRWLVEEAVASPEALISIAQAVNGLDVADVAAVEATAGAASAVIRIDKRAVLAAAPRFSTDLADARERCADSDAQVLLDRLHQLLA